MYTPVTLSAFHAAFKAAGREGNFTHEGREKLFEYMTDGERDGEYESELDVILLCCSYTESTLEEAADAYSVEFADVIDFLDCHTSVVWNGDGRILYANF